MNHERTCPKNLNRKYKNGMLGKKGRNPYHKRRKIIFTDEIRKKIGKANKNKIWTDEMRKKHSIALKKATVDHPDSYFGVNA